MHASTLYFAASSRTAAASERSQLCQVTPGAAFCCASFRSPRCVATTSMPRDAATFASSRPMWPDAPVTSSIGSTLQHVVDAHRLAGLRRTRDRERRRQRHRAATPAQHRLLDAADHVREVAHLLVIGI